MVNSKEIYHFSRFQRGPTFLGGIQLLIPYRNPGGGSGPPVPPSGSALDPGFIIKPNPAGFMRADFWGFMWVL